jgi:hypothetical protein
MPGINPRPTTAVVFPQAVKLDVDFAASFGRTKQAAEKVGNLGGMEENQSSVAKATLDFVGFIRGLKPPTPPVLSFSATCKVVPFQNMCESMCLGSLEGMVLFYPR